MRTLTEARVRTEGGRLSTHDMQQLVQCALDAGLHNARFDHRQTCLLRNDGDKPASTEQINQLNEHLYKSCLRLINDDELNIVSSVPSFRVFGDTDWMDAGVYGVLLRELSVISAQMLKEQTISLIDPKQNLIPLLHSHINCIASSHADYWMVLVCPHELANAPLTYPRLIGSSSLAQFVQTLAQSLISLPFNWETICNTLMQQTKWQQIESAPNHPLEQQAVPHYDGIYRYTDGYWLGIARSSQSFELTALAQLLRMASTQGIEYLHVSTWGALIIKKIQSQHLPQWNWFLSLNRWDEGMSYAHLNWMIPEATTSMTTLHKRIIRKFHEMGLRTWGLSFGLQDEATPIDIRPSILIVREHTELPKLFLWFGSRYRLLIASQFNPLLGEYAIQGEHLTESQLVEQLVLIIAKYQKMSGLERPTTSISATPMSSNPIAPLPKVRPHHGEPSSSHTKDGIYACSVCRTEYHEIWGEPRQKIAPGTPFATLPKYFHCPTCDAEKEAFVSV